MEVRDLWPESIKTVGAMKDGPVLRFFEWLELRLYKSAAMVVSVTDSFKENMISRGIDGEKIQVVKNGANLELYQNQPPEESLKQELGLSGKFILGYIGTHGMAHKLDFILECAQHTQDQDIHYLFVGSGAKKAELLEQAKEHNLTNVTFLDPVAKEEVWKYISILSAMIIPLKKSDLFKTVIPSKIFETAAMGKPILLGVDGESRAIIESYNAGLFFEPENQSHFLEKLNDLKSNPDLYQGLKQGCSSLAKAFDRRKLASKMLNHLKEVSRHGK